VDQVTQRSKSLSQAVASLNREFMAALVTEEAASIGRQVAQIVRGDGWLEAKSSAVLVDAIAGWLGRDSVAAVGFFANGTGPVEIVARVGNFFISGHGIQIEDDLTVNCCERHRARFSQSRIEDWDMSTNTTRFTWGNPAAQEAADRLAVLLTEQVDPEIALVVLGG
jgi:hypothetical protein